jgi:hypothetical protein
MSNLVGTLIQIGAIVCAAGFFLLITPFAEIGFLLLFSGTIVACVPWGTARAKTRQASVTVVGGCLVVVGLVWMWLFSVPWVCAGPGTCYNWLEVVSNPWFLLGLALAAAGVALLALSAASWVRVRRARASRGRTRLVTQ